MKIFDKNIKLPERKKIAEWKDMEKNDSVYFGNKKKYLSAINSARQFVKYHNLNWIIVGRKYNNGYRIWRVE
jgi:hypothetical protein